MVGVVAKLRGVVRRAESLPTLLEQQRHRGNSQTRGKASGAEKERRAVGASDQKDRKLTSSAAGDVSRGSLNRVAPLDLDVGSESSDSSSTCSSARFALPPFGRRSSESDKQERMGKVTVGRRLNVCSSEKDIYDGLYGDLPCVLCFPKADDGSLEREARFLQILQGCPHVIKMHAFIEEPKKCVVLERVDPLGHDLIEVVSQQTNSGRPMPLGQVRYYMMQLAHACQEMEARGVIHRDLKPDNVLVDKDQKVKVIDFGVATFRDSAGSSSRGREPSKVIEVFNVYSAPEVNSCPSSAGNDHWGLGMILYALCFGMNATTKQIVSWASSSKGIRGCLRGVHHDMVEAIEGLLCIDPEARWGLKELKQWAAHTEVPEMPSPGTRLLKRWPYRDMCPQAFGAQLPKGWARSGETIGSLDLMRIGGVHVLMVDRYSEWHKFYAFDSKQRITGAYCNKATNATQWDAPATGVEEPVATPNASTVLREGDWIYFGVNDSNLCTNALRSVISERLGLTEAVGDLGSLARSPSQSTLIQFLPEFEYFKFPRHCVNAVLGMPCHAKEGQNALNLRKVFQVNIAAIVRADGTISWWPGASEAGGGLVGRGDGALVLRVPQWDYKGPILPSVKPDDINDLADVDGFKERLGLDADHRAWREWRQNAGMRTLVRL